jgi:membrane-bound lytic murein transglycosylase D
MRFLLSSSKHLIIAVLSFSLFIGWYSENVEVANLVSAEHSSITSIWGSMRSQLTLDHRTESSRVQAEIRKLLADQDKLYSILQAAGPYIYYILNQTKARGLPAELALIPVIESEFNPNDHSKKGALGLWQLMPKTAHDLGVKVKSSYDGRRNVVDSTKAALAYFNDLGNLFKGNWYLAIAAYNCGEGRVMHAQKQTGNTSYWNLPLPKDTKVYVPRLLAVAEIIKNPEKYGVELPQVDNKPYFAEIKVKKPVNLVQFSKSSGISMDTIHALNPDYKHGVAEKNGSYSLLIPIEKEPVVREQLADRIVTV